MASPEELLEKWKRQTPTEVRIEELLKVARHYIPECIREKTSGSHFLIIEHPFLQYHSAFGGKGRLDLSSTGGRFVKGVWVKSFVKAVELILDYKSWQEGQK